MSNDEDNYNEKDYLLSNLDFDNIFRKGYDSPHLRYGGVFMKDELRDFNPENGKFYIINLDDKNSEGTHWTLICNTQDAVCIYFDSFAVPPSDVIVSFMKRARTKKGKKKSLLYNTIQLQEDNAVSCGWYCAYFALKLSQGKSFVTTLADFNLNFEQWLNERLIEKIKRSSLFAVIRNK